MKKKYDVVIIGLGYVGLTLSVALAETGYRVLGVERRKSIVNLTNNGKAHFQENGLDIALNQAVRNKNLVATTEMQGEVCDIFIITVGTPMNKEGISRLDYIENATKEVMKSMMNDSLVIVRSTVKIGTCRNIVSKILQSSNKVFHLAMCPERTIEGRALQELTTLPQIIGSNSEEGFARAEKVFGRLTKTIVKVSSLDAAEIIKLVDNTSRDVAFAFANEVARICESFEVSALEVISSGKLGYERTNVALPGLVGGPCLEKDPHILAQSLIEKGIEPEITKASRIVNERQPYETVDSIKKEALKRGFIEQIKITIMGLAFKGVPSTDDLRGSMAFKVLDAIEKKFPKAKIFLYDPVISQKVLQDNFPKHNILDDIEDAANRASILVFTNNHPSLTKHRPKEFYKIMSKNGFIYDYWNRYTNLPKEELKGKYFSVGYLGIKKQ